MGARQSHREHRGLGTAIRERDRVGASARSADQFGKISLERIVDTPMPASLDLFRKRALDRLGPVAQHVRAETGGEINIDVAVDVGELSSVGALDVDRMRHHYGLHHFHRQCAGSTGTCLCRTLGTRDQLFPRFFESSLGYFLCHGVLE